MKTCIITGGAGFIGTQLSNDIIDRFDCIVIVDSLIPQVHGEVRIAPKFPTKIHFFRLNICDPGTWDDILSKFTPDVIYHLAAETGTAQSLHEPSNHVRTNVLGLSEMLEGIVRFKCYPKRIILASSRAVYGEGRWENIASKEIFYPKQRSLAQLDNKVWDYSQSKNLPMIFSENIPKPVSIYGMTKYAQEQLLQLWCRANEVDYVILRLQNVYGEGQSLTNSYTGILSLFCRIARTGKSVPVYEDGNMLRDFVYVTDVSAALVKSLDYKNVLERDIIFDIGSGKGITLLNVAEQISKFYKSNSPKVTGDYRIGDVRHAYAECTEAIEFLGWEPEVKIEEGILRLCTWVEETIKE